ncbi:hypothetical protein ACFV1L_21840 [Kitasatospora sp. NPDC059646]|uniref:hypothetical protein n=1 Tax=Kitasatospora sp. NPDC059646 TaxID=3346893 RepID=UPI0036A50140
MTRRTTLEQRARELQKAAKARGQRLRYHDALNQVREAAPRREHAAAEQPSPVEQILAIAYTRQPTPAEATAGVTAAELGVSALPADATPAQRARAEATWCPIGTGLPCRCSGTCQHGTPCPNPDDAEGGCGGELLHTDRYPGSMFALTAWHDEYVCTACGATFEQDVDLPAVPWGEVRPPANTGPWHPESVTVVYDDVRHPNFGTAGEDDDSAETWPDGWDFDPDRDGEDDDRCDCGSAVGYDCVC